MVSSWSTHSPSFLVKSAITPSVMESAISGRGKTFSEWGQGYRQSDTRVGWRVVLFFGARGRFYQVWRTDVQAASCRNSIKINQIKYESLSFQFQLPILPLSPSTTHKIFSFIFDLNITYISFWFFRTHLWKQQYQISLKLSIFVKK